MRSELTSVWLPIQLGLIGLSVVTAIGISVAIRKRADLVSLTMGWPPYLRMVVRALVDHLGPIAFILVVMAVRAALRADVINPRTYLLGVAISLTTAWVINIAAGVIQNVSSTARHGVGLTIAALRSCGCSIR